MLQRITEEEKTVRERNIPHQAQYLRELLSERGTLGVVDGYLVKDQTYSLEDFVQGTVFELHGTTPRTDNDSRMVFKFTTYVEGTSVKPFTNSMCPGNERIVGCMTLPPHYASYINDSIFPCIVVKGNAGPRHLLFVDDGIVPSAHRDGEGLYTCRSCGRRYDGFAQCPC